MRIALVATVSDGGRPRSGAAQHELSVPYARPRVMGKEDVSWTGSTLIVARTTELAEKLLADGELRCPLGNTGQLVAQGIRPTAHRARPRRHTVTVQPRRTPMPIVLINPHRDARRPAATPRRHHRGDRNGFCRRRLKTDPVSTRKGVNFRPPLTDSRSPR